MTDFSNRKTTVKITNKTQDFAISENAKLADSFFGRFRGLMLSAPKDIVLVSPKETIAHSSIHMLFMRFPIDVIWLSSEMVVVDIQRKLKPNTMKISKPQKAAKYVVEIGHGDAGKTKIGDTLGFI